MATRRRSTTSSEIMDSLRRARELVDREHEIINERANIFLLANSILITSYILSKNYFIRGPLSYLSLLITWFGLFFTIVWMYVRYRALRFEKIYWEETIKLEKYVDKRTRLYSYLRTTHTKGIRATIILALFLPFLWMMLWAIILVLTLKTYVYLYLFFVILTMPTLRISKKASEVNQTRLPHPPPLI